MKTNEALLMKESDKTKAELLTICERYPSGNLNDFINKSIDKAEQVGGETRDKAIILAHIVFKELGLGRNSVISTILYELLYSGKITNEEIVDNYPPTIIHLIRGLDKIEELYQKQKRVNADIFQKLLLTLAEDVRVILIMLVRRFYALRNIEKIEKEEQKNIVDEITFVYLPFAHRLGLYNIKMEMEDRLLRKNEPQVYQNISKELRDSEKERIEFIEEFMRPIKEELNKQNFRYAIKYRTKSIASILAKIRKQGVSLSEIYDIFAIRIIISTEEKFEKRDCWHAYSIVSDIYRPNPKRLRDWITIPKSTGYESLHTTVMTPENRWVEVQIRTQRMDDIAEKGFAAHWRYKDVKNVEMLDEWLVNVREILEQEGQSGSDDIMEDMLLELSDKEIYVFTPSGELKQLPRGATVLDFAYSIHGDLGNKCTGAKVNTKNVPIRHKLHSGDQVSIMSSKKQKPSRDWLQIVVTSKAKSHIRQSLKKEEAQYANIGKEMLMRRMKNWDIEFNDFVVRDLLAFFRKNQVHELYRAIADEKIDLLDVKNFLEKEDETEITKLPILEAEDRESTTVQKQYEDVLIVAENISGVDYSLASCCSPVFGDDIFGFVSVSKGIKIHRTNCPNASYMKQRYAYRILPAKWTNQGNNFFVVNLYVLIEDKQGILSKITELIADYSSINMRGISFAGESLQTEGRLTLEVPNKDMLDTIIAKIQEIKGVMRVARRDN